MDPKEQRVWFQRVLSETQTPLKRSNSDTLSVIESQQEQYLQMRKKLKEEEKQKDDERNKKLKDLYGEDRVTMLDELKGIAKGESMFFQNLDMGLDRQWNPNPEANILPKAKSLPKAFTSFSSKRKREPSVNIRIFLQLPEDIQAIILRELAETDPFSILALRELSVSFYLALRTPVAKQAIRIGSKPWMSIRKEIIALGERSKMALLWADENMTESMGYPNCVGKIPSKKQHRYFLIHDKEELYDFLQVQKMRLLGYQPPDSRRSPKNILEHILDNARKENNTSIIRIVHKFHQAVKWRSKSSNPIPWSQDQLISNQKSSLGHALFYSPTYVPDVIVESRIGWNNRVLRSVYSCPGVTPKEARYFERCFSRLDSYKDRNELVLEELKPFSIIISLGLVDLYHIYNTYARGMHDRIGHHVSTYTKLFFFPACRDAVSVLLRLPKPGDPEFDRARLMRNPWSYLREIPSIFVRIEYGVASYLLGADYKQEKGPFPDGLYEDKCNNYGKLFAAIYERYRFTPLCILSSNPDYAVSLGEFCDFVENEKTLLESMKSQLLTLISN